ncbi:MAG: hypothetical protein AAF518_23375 [Spirochaetota bacterium]
MIVAVFPSNGDLSQATEENKNIALTSCLLEHYGAEYNKATPPFQIHQDGY